MKRTRGEGRGEGVERERKLEKLNNKRDCGFLPSFATHSPLFMLQGLLISCNQMSAEYLFMTDKLYDVKYDTGDKVIQCGRHNDIFKLWLQWRAKVHAHVTIVTKLERVETEIIERSCRISRSKFHRLE